eukprot:TRINITY_DN12608_c0_g1_i1.p1 TRINITY_DN12608_c0_g1~~TRINITY_DN12608_c0_g1_i1.p1  ORF type:complete len:285 (+),score=75.10 TRINITY_DN12608_c0_g1_i1:156-1010(+)
MMLADSMWSVQNALHGNNKAVLVPAILLSCATLLVVYCHANDGHGEDPKKTFLLLIVVQMVPLVFLELKILSCPDPVGMLSRFGTKVLLMHVAFLGLRIMAWPLLVVGNGFFNLLGFAAACLALRRGFGFQCSLASLREHVDVFALISVAALAALATEFLNARTSYALLGLTLFTMTSYVEILAFVPAVWMVHRSRHGDAELQKDDGHGQCRAAAFFAFFVTFYFLEDMMSAFRMLSVDMLVSAGHTVHFLLVLDFACFLLAHVYNPEKIPGYVMRWFPEQLWV